MFKSGDLVRAIGIPGPTLAQWLDRGVVEMRPGDIDAATSGTPRLYGRRRVDQIAIAHALTRAGIAAATAAKAAAQFTDHSQPDRAAGELFKDGKTVLAVTSDDTAVLNAPADVALQEVAAGLGDVVVLVDLNAVVARVDRGLAGTPRRPS